MVEDLLMCSSLAMLQLCFIFVVSKGRTEDKERRDEDSERGDEERERRYRERKVCRPQPQILKAGALLESFVTVQGLRKFSSLCVVRYASSHWQVCLIPTVIVDYFGKFQKYKQIRRRK